MCFVLVTRTSELTRGVFFYFRLFAIGSQLSPEVGSSGIEMLETDVFKLHCFQTLTGVWRCPHKPLISLIYFSVLKRIMVLSV